VPVVLKVAVFGVERALAEEGCGARREDFVLTLRPNLVAAAKE
jgi:hypothetical protein